MEPEILSLVRRRLPLLLAVVLSLAGIGLLAASQRNWPTGWLGWNHGPMLYGQVIKGSVVVSWLGDLQSPGDFVAWTEVRGPRRAERRESASWLGRFDWLRIPGVSTSVIFPLVALLPLPWLWPLWRWVKRRREA